MSGSKKLWAVVLVAAPFVLALLCLGFGRYSLSVSETIATLLAGKGGSDAVSATATSVIWSIRLPRIMLALVVGAGLAVSGAAFQGLFTNPLATPDTLGVAAGASFGAALGLLMGQNLVIVQILALVFGLVAVALTCSISRIKGQSSIIMVVLAGMVIAALFQALVSLIKYAADPQDTLPAITYWLMGSLNGTTYKSFFLGLPFILVGVCIIFLLRWRLNIMTLSEDEAKAMGINVKRIRTVIIISATLVTASSVSMCGQVGWVGLLIPHLSRMLYGSNNRYVVPVSISLGACFMVIIDTFARSATAAEIPISILTAIIGAPVFISLLRKTGGAWL